MPLLEINQTADDVVDKALNYVFSKDRDFQDFLKTAQAKEVPSTLRVRKGPNLPDPLRSDVANIYREIDCRLAVRRIRRASKYGQSRSGQRNGFLCTRLPSAIAQLEKLLSPGDASGDCERRLLLAR